MPKSPDFFIVSSGRAGSTLLQSILNANEQLYIPQESDFVARAYPFFHEKSVFGESDYAQLTSLFCATSQSNGWGMSQQYILDYLNREKPQSYADVFSKICEAYHTSQQSQSLKWGIKRPVLIASLDRIKKTYPQAKIVHIHRDGRDVHLSYRRLNTKGEIKFGPSSVVTSALYWVDGLRRVESFLENTPSDSQDIFEVSYENLVRQPKVTVEKLCRFLEIEFAPPMVERFNQADKRKQVAPAELMSSIHKKIGQGLDPNNTEKYLTQMSRVQTLLFELLTAPYLRKYNYPLKFRWTVSWLFFPLRRVLYFSARSFNDIRYAKRDKRFYNASLAKTDNLLLAPKAHHQAL